MQKLIKENYVFEIYHRLTFVYFCCGIHHIVFIMLLISSAFWICGFTFFNTFGNFSNISSCTKVPLFVPQSRKVSLVGHTSLVSLLSQITAYRPVSETVASYTLFSGCLQQKDECDTSCSNFPGNRSPTIFVFRLCFFFFSPYQSVRPFKAVRGSHSMPNMELAHRRRSKYY